MQPKDKDIEKETPDGAWQDIDSVECDVEYQDDYDDNLIEFLKKENPELLEIMKKNGFEVE